MSKKYFNYSFQIKRTKTTGIIFLIFSIAIIGIFVNWYNNRNIKYNLGKMNYTAYIGMNDIKTKECQKAYKINYKKSTCSTICINEIDYNENYLKDVKSQMEEAEFKFYDISSTKVGSEKGYQLFTKNNEPEFKFFAINKNKKTYTIEYINQSQHLSKKYQNKCNKIFNKFKNSIKIND